MSEIIVKGNEIVSGARVYDLDESLVAAGYAKRTDCIDYSSEKVSNKDYKRAARLIKAVENDNNAHGQFLSGILVSFDLTFSVKAWTEAERYKFLTFVTSQSTMHRIANMDYSTCFDNHVDGRCKEIVRQLCLEYEEEADPIKKKEKYLNLLYSCPTGVRLTARLTTNYRCLRNIYKQRKTHRLPEWIRFCNWIEMLPKFDELIAEHNEKIN